MDIIIISTPTTESGHPCMNELAKNNNKPGIANAATGEKIA
jgi:hypothetical protein